jgi:ubiquinone/menaquinone biosynthesis C-methylase UbiE
MKRQDIEAEIKFFDRVAEERGHFDSVSEDVYDLIFFQITPYLNGRCLEAGCGSGSFGERIKAKKPNIDLIGVDLNQKSIDTVREKSNYIQLIAGNVEDANLFEAQSLDTIVCPYLMHHLPDIHCSMENFYVWLKPGGHLVIIDPNGSNLVMKASYLLRMLLSYFMDVRNYASVNERHKAVTEFKKNLKQYKIISIKTFKHKESESFSSGCSLWLLVLGRLRNLLLKCYELIPFFKYKGSDLIIIAQKGEKI